MNTTERVTPSAVEAVASKTEADDESKTRGHSRSDAAGAVPVASVVPLAPLQAIVAELRGMHATWYHRLADRIEAAAAAQAGEQQPFCWIYGNEERTLKAHGTALVYEQKQLFSLTPHEDGTPLYRAPVAQGWQPITNPPPGYATVLCTNAEREHYEAYYQQHDGGTDGHKAGNWYGDDGQVYPTHWMPLPEPPPR